MLPQPGPSGRVPTPAHVKREMAEHADQYIANLNVECATRHRLVETFRAGPWSTQGTRLKGAIERLKLCERRVMDTEREIRETEEMVTNEEELRDRLSLDKNRVQDYNDSQHEVTMHQLELGLLQNKQKENDSRLNAAREALEWVEQVVAGHDTELGRLEEKYRAARTRREHWEMAKRVAESDGVDTIKNHHSRVRARLQQLYAEVDGKQFIEDLYCGRR